MLIERKEALNSEKGMSDHEIKFFKGYSDVKIVSRNKRKAFQSVHTLLIFDRYSDYCASLPVRNFNIKLYNNKKLKKIISHYPFSVGGINLNLSKLSYMFDKSIYDSFSIKSGCLMCNEYDLNDIIGLSTATIARLNKLFESMEIENGSN
jgi:hypothetical protein